MRNAHKKIAKICLRLDSAFTPRQEAHDAPPDPLVGQGTASFLPESVHVGYVGKTCECAKFC